MKKGDRIKVKDNLVNELIRLGFDKNSSESMRVFENTEQIVMDIFEKEETIYLTVDLCCEIPLQCCEAVVCSWKDGGGWDDLTHFVSNSDRMEKETYTDHNGNKAEFDKLLPCPFCGGIPELKFKGNNDTKSRSVTVRCKGCNAERTIGAVHYTALWCAEKSINKWNKRI